MPIKWFYRHWYTVNKAVKRLSLSEVMNPPHTLHPGPHIVPSKGSEGKTGKSSKNAVDTSPGKFTSISQRHDTFSIEQRESRQDSDAKCSSSSAFYLTFRHSASLRPPLGSILLFSTVVLVISLLHGESDWVSHCNLQISLYPIEYKIKQDI